ncbi:unnamed protein product [Cunninghamella blakesleeana]
MKSQLFILGLFAAFVLAKEEKGAELHTYDENNCFNVSLNSQCNSGDKVGYVSPKGAYFDKNKKPVTRCCKSKGEAHDERDENEGPEKEKEGGNHEAGVPSYVRRSNRKMKRKII